MSAMKALKAGIIDFSKFKIIIRNCVDRIARATKQPLIIVTVQAHDMKFLMRPFLRVNHAERLFMDRAMVFHTRQQDAGRRLMHRARLAGEAGYILRRQFRRRELNGRGLFADSRRDVHKQPCLAAAATGGFTPRVWRDAVLLSAVRIRAGFDFIHGGALQEPAAAAGQRGWRHSDHPDLAPDGNRAASRLR